MTEKRQQKRQTFDLSTKLEIIKYAEETSNREAGRKFILDESMVRRWRKNKTKLEEKSLSKSKVTEENKVEKRQPLDLNSKLEIVKFAEETSNRQAGRKFFVDESMVRRWRKNKAKIEEQSLSKSRNKRLLGAGRKPVLRRDLEEILLERVMKAKEVQNHVPGKLITDWAKELANANDVTGFQASHGWLFNFMKRTNLSLGRHAATDEGSLHASRPTMVGEVGSNSKYVKIETAEDLTDNLLEQSEVDVISI